MELRELNRITMFATAAVATSALAVALAAPVTGHAATFRDVVSRSAAGPPVCPTPGTGVQIVGLRPRVPYGRRDVFRVRRTTATGPIDVAMTIAGASRPFFATTFERTPRRLYVQLELGDPPATIAASYVQVQVDGSPCTAATTATIRGYRHLFVANVCGRRGYRPRRIVLACGDGNFQLVGMRWAHWNDDAVTGHGQVLLNDCIPFCAGGTFHRYPARVTLSRARMCADRYYYTRLRIGYTAQRPSDAPTRWAVGCPRER